MALHKIMFSVTEETYRALVEEQRETGMPKVHDVIRGVLKEWYRERMKKQVEKVEPIQSAWIPRRI